MNPLAKRIKRAADTSIDTIADYSSRMFERLNVVHQRFEAIEQRTSTASDRLAKSLLTAKRGTVTDELIVAAAKEFIAVFLEGAEERSQLRIELAEAKAEIEQAQELARDGKFDLANVIMLAKTAKLFMQVDQPTVKVAIEEFDLAALQQALEEVSAIRWLELETAFEAARKGRK